MSAGSRWRLWRPDGDPCGPGGRHGRDRASGGAWTGQCGVDPSAACRLPDTVGATWVFVRRLTIATRGGSVAPAFALALARLATAGADPDVVVFPDFAAVAPASRAICWAVSRRQGGTGAGSGCWNGGRTRRRQSACWRSSRWKHGRSRPVARRGTAGPDLACAHSGRRGRAARRDWLGDRSDAARSDRGRTRLPLATRLQPAVGSGARRLPRRRRRVSRPTPPRCCHCCDGTQWHWPPGQTRQRHWWRSRRHGARGSPRRPAALREAREVPNRHPRESGDPAPRQLGPRFRGDDDWSSTNTGLGKSE